MSKVSQLTGMKFGRLTVTKQVASDSRGRSRWLCLCDCGMTKDVLGKHLLSGAIVSCGCYAREMTSVARRLDLTGQKFGRLTAIERLPKRKRGLIVWKFRCDCGSMFEAPGSTVKSGNTKSCGCLQPEITAHLKETHGERRSATYNSWASMIQRCTNKFNPGYKHYGGRGIIVCKQWIDSFETFLKDMGHRPIGKTLGRIDNNGNYEPENCRWETSKQQGYNKRTTVFVEFEETEMLLKNACSLSCVSYRNVIWRKGKHQMSHQEAFDYYLEKAQS